MTWHQKNTPEKTQHLIANLLDTASKGHPIVVEGKKDAHALQTLGLTGTILTAKTGGKSFLDATDEIKAQGKREVILLLDFDRRGQEGTKRLQHNLEHAKIKANTHFWHELQNLIGHDIQCIESLPNYFTTTQQKTDKHKKRTNTKNGQTQKTNKQTNQLI